MPYCINCGKELAAGAKFCFECGAPVNASTAENHTKRKTVYDGEIHKCPNCGEILSSFVITCPACSYELRGAKSSGSVREFADKIVSAPNDQQMINLIRSFSIPNTKEDILEFFILASSNYDSYFDNEAVSNAWLAKIEQCYQKAKMLLKNDSEYEEIQTLYTQIHAKIKAAKKKKAFNTTGKTALSLMRNLFDIAVRSVGVICSMASFLKAIRIDRTGENGVGYELLGGVFLIGSALLLLRDKVKAIDILITAGGCALTFVLAKQLDNGAGLQLMGGLAILLTAGALIKFLFPDKNQ